MDFVLVFNEVSDFGLSNHKFMSEEMSHTPYLIKSNIVSDIVLAVSGFRSVPSSIPSPPGLIVTTSTTPKITAITVVNKMYTIARAPIFLLNDKSSGAMAAIRDDMISGKIKTRIMRKKMSPMKFTYITVLASYVE